ncbi:MAG: hypothetical protein WD275_06175 [Rhodothermales bacterium]
MLSAVRYFLLLVAVGAGMGCETGVNPIAGEERPYTLWGLFDAGSDTQRVRVFEINDSPGFDDEDIDAAVVSTDLTTGDRRVWCHRRSVDDDGDARHVFWSPFRAIRGHTYRLEVNRSDGAMSSATATVPEGIEVNLDPNTTEYLLPVTIKGPPNVIWVEMRYEATNLPPVNVLPQGSLPAPLLFFPVEVSYEGKGTQIDGGWSYLIDMKEDAEKVRAAYELNCLVTAEHPNIALRRVEFHFVAASEAWVPPGGVFDPEVLVEPGTMSNVDNGYGFFGAGEIFRVRWTPVRSLREFLGYRDDQDEYGSDPPRPCIGENPSNIWDLYF